MKMKNLATKRMLSIALTFVLIICMLPINTFVASAAEVDSVNLTISPDLLLAGASYTDTEYEKTSNVTVDTTNCTVESIRWEDGGGFPLTNEYLLNSNFEYTILLVLKANTGESFAPLATATVNGESTSVLDRYSYDKLMIEWKFFPNVIGTVSSIDITTPVATTGNTATPYSYSHIEGGETLYTVKGDWQEYDESTKEYKAVASTDTFKADRSYRLSLQFKAAPGYVFDALSVQANGEWLNLDASNYSECNGNLYFASGEEISEVFLSVPDPVVGQSFSNATPIKVTVPSDSNYTAEGNWRDEYGNLTGTFAEGKEYFFESKFYANDGYCFAKDLGVYENDFSYNWCPGSGKTAVYLYRKSLKYHIEEVILNNVPKAELNKPLQTGTFALEVPADAKYEASAQWFEDGAPISSSTVQADKKYTLEIWLHADDQYDFATPCILKINGNDHQINGGYRDDVYSMEYSFLDRIHQLEVIGVVKPVVGQTPSTDTLKPAEPEKYEIVSADWLDLEDGLVVTKFENGHNYELNITVKAKEGYEFAPYASWSLDGEKGTLSSSAELQCHIYKNYSFETVLSEIQLNNIPSVKVGETATTDISVPAGAKYTAYADWSVWNNTKNSFESFSGVFQQNKTYRLTMMIFSNAGYRFDKETTLCYMDGVLSKDIEIDSTIAFYGKDFVQQGAKEIHKVEFSVKKPKTGSHSSVDPILTMPQNANYYQNPYSIPNWFVGDIKQYSLFTGYFEEDGNYGVRADLVAKEGYVFAKDLVVVVNGIVLPAEAYKNGTSKTVGISYLFDMTCQHISENETDGTATCVKKKVCTVCGQEYGELVAHTYENGKCTVCGAADPDYTPKVDIPKTGDNSNLLLWFALMFVSYAGIFGITLYDRKKKSDK